MAHQFDVFILPANLVTVARVIRPEASVIAIGSLAHHGSLSLGLANNQVCVLISRDKLPELLDQILGALMAAVVICKTGKRIT